MTTSGPKFKTPEKKEAQARPTTEAEVMARSAEIVASGKKRTGRRPGKEPVKGITLSLPLTIIDALDELAAERCGGSRSFALVGVIRGKFKLDEKNDSTL